MNPKTYSETAAPFWPTAALFISLAFGIAGVMLFYLNRHTVVPAAWGSAGGARYNLVGWFDTVQLGLVVPMLAGLFGNLILRRRIVPRLGWLFMSLSLVAGLMNFFSEYAVFGVYTLTEPLPGTFLVAWVNNFAWVILISLALYLLALFPNGRFLSRRWRNVIFVLLISFSGPFLVASAIETPLSSSFQIPNQILSGYSESRLSVLFNLGALSMFLLMIVVLAAVIWRYRLSQGRERHQMKWLLAGVTLMALAHGSGFGLSFGLGLSLGDIIVNGSILWALSGIGVALVRHRLYDIDIIIQRTLLYTAISAALAMVYFSSILLLQTLFNNVVTTRSPIFVTVSTLVAVALFNPLHRRLQTFIDRRFFRQKYNAQQILVQFGRTARDETDLDTLQVQLSQVVQQTLQPQELSFWLKK